MSVGVAELDIQHRELLSMINDLYEAMGSGTEKLVLHGILDRLVRYVGSHFAYEEDLMVRYGYPDYSTHKSQHNELDERAFTVLVREERGATLGLSVETLNLLRDWLTHHILGSDASLGAFLNEKGVR